MIIFTKSMKGWEKSGSILPTESVYRIAVDALDPEPAPLPCAEAVAEVERRIAAGVDSFRFELASPPASAKNRARKRAQKVIKRILKSTKKETGKQRRARLKKSGLCTACGRRKARKGRCECKSCADYYAQWARKAAKQ